MAEHNDWNKKAEHKGLTQRPDTMRVIKYPIAAHGLTQ